ncbi:MAG: hypothetical protein AAF805_03670, partial [Planctomycetota bacterium]
MPAVPIAADRVALVAIAFALAAVSFLGVPTAAAAGGPQIVAAELGVGGVYKLGRWSPLRVTVEPGDDAVESAAEGFELVAVAADNDGVGVATTPPGQRPIAIDPTAPTKGTAYVRVGRRGSTVGVRLYRRGRVAASMRMPLGSSDPQAIAAGAAAGPATPASDTLWLTAGPSVGLAETLDLVNGDA